MPSIPINSGELYFTDSGFGEPVILIHGFTASGSMWENQRSALEGSYRVIAPDLRGHGRTPLADGRVSMDDLVGDMALLMDALGLGKAHVAGISMGGMVAQSLAFEHPGRVSSLAFLDSFTGNIPSHVIEMFDHHARMGKEAGLEALFDHVLSHPALPMGPGGEFSLEFLASNKKEFIKNDPAALSAYVSMFRGLEDWSSRLSSIQVPCLLVVGELDFESLPHMVRMRELIPDSEFHVIPGCGHPCVAEKPSDFNRLYLNFLDRVREG